MTDLVLLQNIAQKDADSFEELYRRYNKELFQKCYARVRDVIKAEEIMQNLWIEIWERPEIIKVDEEGSAAAILSSYLFFRVLDRFRKDRTEVTAQVNSVPLEDIENSLSHSLISNELDIEDFEEVVTDILDELPGQQAEIIMMLYRDGYTVKETAKILNLHERTVRAHKNQSLSHLRKQINKAYPEVSKFKIAKTNGSAIVYIILLLDQINF